MDFTPSPGNSGRPSAERGGMGRAPAVAIAGTLIATVFLTAITMELLRRYQFPEGSPGWITLGYQLPGALLALWIHKQRQAERDLSFSVRALSWIPLLHIALLVGVHSIWSHLSIDSRQWWQLELMESVPYESIILVSAGLLLYSMLWSATPKGRQRAQSWLLTITVFAVSFLFLLGLWLPFVCGATQGVTDVNWFLGGPKLLVPGFVSTVMLPPALLAFCVAALLPAHAAVLQRDLRPLGWVVACAVFVGFTSRMNATRDEALAYANFIPILLCIAALCLLCIANLAATQWFRLRRIQKLSSRGRAGLISGTVVSSLDEGPPGRLLSLGWLAGLQTEHAGFVLRTKEGDLPVPKGAELAIPLPLWTTSAPKGSWGAILSVGDKVTVSGFVSPSGGQPFRTNAVPVPGTEGIVVMKSEAEPWDTWREVTLATWRPALLYVIASGIIALPGLAGYFAL